ncbi:MAG: hypothetical protein FJX21_17170 [Alphaproteobacteria bacterium]|nr:hypothetical protein [Alphaproteobacteria bacterium]
MPFMTAVAFDTMKLVRRLEAAGMNQPQATGVAEALAETMVVEPATRTDLQRLDARLAGEISALRVEVEKFRGEMRTEFALVRGEMLAESARILGEMQAGLAAVKFEMLRWLLPLFLAQMAMIVGVLVRLQP